MATPTSSGPTTFLPPHTISLRRSPSIPVLGNHEVNSTYYFQYFHLPENGSAGYEEHWWYKDYGNVRFMGLDSNAPYDGDDQLGLAFADVLEATCDLGAHRLCLCRVAPSPQE